jgi:predicted NUDIX family phosphoesterase
LQGTLPGMSVARLRDVVRAARLGRMVEQVLVLPRDRVPGGCDFTGIREADAAALLDLGRAVSEHGRFLDRPTAEESPEWKQLIPYVVVRDGGDVFLMERTDAGGDPRLHRKATIGVGGHINPVDEGGDPLTDGLVREWAEELVADWEPRFELVGFLNDDSNPVGSVHLGVVFTVEADGRPVTVRETHKLTGRFASPAEVMAAWDRMETWSQLVAAHLLNR